MKSKIVTAYWMDVNGYPFQGSSNVRKPRYLGSLIAHCKNINLPIVCYTHTKNLEELEDIKSKYELSNLEIKLLELTDVKCHKEINEVRERNFSTDLDGRGPEIMWGKFDVLGRELDGFDNVYWVDCGLQHPGIFPWRYCKKYNKIEDHKNLSSPWWSEYDSHNFGSLFNTEIFNNLNKMCDNKIALLTSLSPQISYPFLSKNMVDYNFTSPYPVGGLIGGNVNILKKYITLYWDFAKVVLENDFLCTEEAIMKVIYDKMDTNEIIDLKFSAYASGEHDDFHFNMWDIKSNNPKPLYMVWHDIISYNEN
jgi:hypothetical protein